MDSAQYADLLLNLNYYCSALVGVTLSLVVAITWKG